MPNFVWGELDRISFKCAIDAAYKRLSSGAETSSRFHLARLVKHLFANSFVSFRHMLKEASLSQSVPLTCAMTMPALVLQRPHQSSKPKEHVNCLE